MKFFINFEGEEQGPINSAQLKKLAEQGRINKDILIRKEDSSNWHRAETVKGLFASSKKGELIRRPVDVILQPEPISQKNCDFCGEEISITAKKCRYCGEILDVILRSSMSSNQNPNIVIQNTNSMATNVAHGAQWSPMVAALLSFVIPGLGQFYKGQPINGLVWFVIVLGGYVAFIIPGLVLHACCILGAAMGK